MRMLSLAILACLLALVAVMAGGWSTPSGSALAVASARPNNDGRAVPALSSEAAEVAEAERLPGATWSPVSLARVDAPYFLRARVVVAAPEVAATGGRTLVM